MVRKTSGEAREIVSKIPLTNLSCALAWKSLKDTYDNSRLLVHNQLQIHFSLPSLEPETSLFMKSTQRGIYGCLTAMIIYDVKTNNWDPFLVFICLQRLPKLTQKFWDELAHLCACME